MLKKLIYLLKFYGLFGFLSIIRSRIPYLCRSSNYRFYQKLLRNKKGIEIGGPSKIFSKKGILPIYPVIEGLDGCNFKGKTIWEGEIVPGDTYLFESSKPKGYQYLCEATELKDVLSGEYDFVLSAHCLEHIANPFKALGEWLRILKKNGILLLVVPQKEKTFDCRRAVTSFDHLRDDFEKDTKEDDLSHLSEILELHDISLDYKIPDHDAFVERSFKNYENRCLHHHVYDPALLIEIFDYFKLQILSIDFAWPEHIIMMGQKTNAF